MLYLTSMSPRIALSSSTGSRRVVRMEPSGIHSSPAPSWQGSVQSAAPSQAFLRAFPQPVSSGHDGFASQPTQHAPSLYPAPVLPPPPPRGSYPSTRGYGVEEFTPSRPASDRRDAPSAHSSGRWGGVESRETRRHRRPAEVHTSSARERPGSSSSLTRNYSLEKWEKKFFNELASQSRDVQGVQPIFQLHIPGAGIGVCTSLTKKWIESHSRLPSREASIEFGRVINEDHPSLVAMQREISDVKRAINADAASGRFPRAELDERRRAIYRFETGGLQRVGLPVDGRMSSSAGKSASRMLQGMTEDGFYRLSFADPSAHVLGVQISHGTREFKLMDPNIGEFSAKSFDGFSELLENIMRSREYHQIYENFRADRFV